MAVPPRLQRAAALVVLLLAWVTAPEARAQQEVEGVLEGLGTATTADPGSEGTGVVLGRVFDATTGNALARVTVVLKWSPPATGGAPRQEVRTTGPEGDFEFENVPPGVYSVSFIRSGYRNSTMTGFRVEADQLNRADFPMPPLAAGTSDEILELEEFVVSEETAQEIVTSLETRLEADELLNVFSAEDFSKFAAGDVAEALERVSGVNIVDGQFAIIRGLEDRYSSTTLNGSPVPSPDPTRQSVQLDLFPADVVTNLVVSKTFSGDQQSNSSGGSIDISTLDYEEGFEFKFSAGTGYNDRAEDRFIGFVNRSSAEEILRGVEVENDVPLTALQLDEIFLNPQVRLVQGSSVGRERVKSGEFFEDVDNVLESDFNFSFSGKRRFADREFRFKLVGAQEIDFSTLEGTREERQPRAPGVLPGEFEIIRNPNPPPRFISIQTPDTLVRSGDLNLGQLSLSEGRFDLTESTREEKRTGYAAFGFDLDDDGLHRIDAFVLFSQNIDETAQLRENGFIPGLDVQRLVARQVPPGDPLFVDVPIPVPIDPRVDEDFRDVTAVDAYIARSIRELIDLDPSAGALAIAPRQEQVSFQTDRDLLVYQVGGDHRLEGLPGFNLRWLLSKARTNQEEVNLRTRMFFEPCGLTATATLACPEGVDPLTNAELIEIGGTANDRNLTGVQAVDLDLLGTGFWVSDTTELIVNPVDIEERQRFARVDGDYELDLSPASRVKVGGGWWSERAVRNVLSGFTQNPGVAGPPDDDELVNCLNPTSGNRVCFGETPELVADYQFGHLTLREDGQVAGLTLQTNESRREIDAWYIKGKWTGWDRFDIQGSLRREKLVLETINDPFQRNAAGEITFDSGGPQIFPGRYVYLDRFDNPANPFEAGLTPNPDQPPPTFDDEILGIELPTDENGFVDYLCDGLVGEACPGVARLRALLSNRIEDKFTFPSVGLGWRPLEGLSLRGAWSRTIARPSFRELGYYATLDRGSDEFVLGNPQLGLSEVESWDVRVEFTWGSGDLMAWSGFTKRIEDPIESIVVPNNQFRSANTPPQRFRTFFNNPNTANLQGLEAEFRKSLGFLASETLGTLETPWWTLEIPGWGLAPDWFRYFSIGGNVTVIDAEVARTDAELARSTRFFGVVEGDPNLFPEIERTRRLFNQPAWIWNIDLSFDHPDWGTKFTVAFFEISDRLEAIGVAVLEPDQVNTRSLTLDRFEKSFHTLTVTFSQKFDLPGELGSLRFSFSGKNLTDSTRGSFYDPAQTLDRIERERFRVGRDYSLSMSYTRPF